MKLRFFFFFLTCQCSGLILEGKNMWGVYFEIHFVSVAYWS